MRTPPAPKSSWGGEREREVVLSLRQMESSTGAAVGAFPPAPAAIGPVRTERQARDWSLVLDAMRIGHAVRQHDAGLFLVVQPGDARAALDAIASYEKENRDWPPRRARERLPFRASPIAALVFAALLVFHGTLGRTGAFAALTARGASVSHLVLAGEPWRAVTALTLHADGPHVLGNVLAGTLFVTALERRLGPGRAVFYTLGAGTLGNLANALWHRAGHASVGASTAVFAAVGLLVATQLAADRVVASTASRLARTAPVVGGLALLGVLGASPHADLLAHLFGLVAGVVVGLPVARLDRATGRGVQVAYGLASTALVAGSWALALR